MKAEKFETRMFLTVPGRGRITIEGSKEFVRRFFLDVKIQFIEEMSAALKFDPMFQGKDLEVIETHHSPKETTLEIVEKAS